MQHVSIIVTYEIKNMLKLIKFEESSQIDSLNNKFLLVYFDLTQFLAANAFGNLPSHHSYCLQPVCIKEMITLKCKI